MSRALALVVASSTLAAHGAPLCAEEGLWGTARCLTVETSSLGIDAAKYVFTTAASPYFSFVQVPMVQVMEQAASLYWKLTQKFNFFGKSEKDGKASKTVKFNQASQKHNSLDSLKEAAERHRTAFVASFPKHAAVLPAGDSAGLWQLVLTLLSPLRLCGTP